MIVSINGVLTTVEDARIDPRDRGFTLGDGVFETIAIRKGKAPRLQAHLNRLRSGLQAIGLTITQGDQDLASAIGDVLLANNTMDAAVRLTVSRGVGARGIVPPNPGTPTIVITAN